MEPVRESIKPPIIESIQKAEQAFDDYGDILLDWYRKGDTLLLMPPKSKEAELGKHFQNLRMFEVGNEISDCVTKRGIEIDQEKSAQKLEKLVEDYLSLGDEAEKIVRLETFLEIHFKNRGLIPEVSAKAITLAIEKCPADIDLSTMDSSDFVHYMSWSVNPGFIVDSKNRGDVVKFVQALEKTKLDNEADQSLDVVKGMYAGSVIREKFSEKDNGRLVINEANEFLKTLELPTINRDEFGSDLSSSEFVAHLTKSDINALSLGVILGHDQTRADSVKPLIGATDQRAEVSMKFAASRKILYGIFQSKFPDQASIINGVMKTISSKASY